MKKRGRKIWVILTSAALTFALLSAFSGRHHRHNWKDHRKHRCEEQHQDRGWENSRDAYDYQDNYDRYDYRDRGYAPREYRGREYDRYPEYGPRYDDRGYDYPDHRYDYRDHPHHDRGPWHHGPWYRGR